MRTATHEGAAARDGRRRGGVVLRSLNDVAEELRRPFVAEATEFMCIATNDRHNPTRALVAPYVQRTAVERRLDEVAGPENWSVAYRESNPGEFAVICSLTILGVTKESYGQGTSPWSQEANAFKRAARLFGVGRYLAEMRSVWLAIGEGAEQVQQRGNGFVVPDALAARLREGLAERIELTYAARYGPPLERYAEPGSLSDEGEVHGEGDAGMAAPEAGGAAPGPEQSATRRRGMEALSAGPGSDGRKPPPSPDARGALQDAIERCGYSEETVRRASKLFYDTSITERLAEAEARELANRLEAIATAEIEEGAFKGCLTKALELEDREAARHRLAAWVQRRASRAREDGRNGGER